MGLGWMLWSTFVYATELRPREAWSRERLLRYQEQTLRRLLRHAVTHSSFYRDLYRGIDLNRAPLQALPTVDKPTLMARFDEAVTDPRLHLDDLKRHLEHAGKEELYLGKYLVMATSGSSGVRGIFPFTRKAVATFLAQGMRVSAMNRFRVRLPMRTVWVAGSMAAHGTYRASGLGNGGPVTSTALSADMPLGELAERLDCYHPDALFTYPTALSLLATAQLEGQLHIDPRMIGIGGEVRLPGLAEAVARAWPGAVLMESYAATEVGMVGGSCPECGGLHLFEDTCIIEAVDADGRPVHPGETAARLLVTNLFNPVMPLIRYELTDAVTLADGTNRCGRPWTTLTTVDGRSDEILYLPDRAGGTAAVPPSRFRNLLGPDPAVREYQVTLYPDRLEVAVVPSPGAGKATDWVPRLTGALQSQLAELGAVPPAIRVFQVDALARQNGKLKLVRSVSR